MNGGARGKFVGREQAPAVVVDDLHWADLASAQVLLFGVRG